VNDAGVIRLVRAYLNAGIMDGGVVVERDEGTPQGGPLSPLLANVLLDEVPMNRKVGCQCVWSQIAGVCPMGSAERRGQACGVEESA
jgi:hypothetical protein